MTISQVQLSNTFNEFRSTFNTAANTINSLQDASGTITANVVTGITVTGTTLTASGLSADKVLITGAGGLLTTDAGLDFTASSNTLSVNGPVTVNSLTSNGAISGTNATATGNLAVTGTSTLTGTTTFGSGANNAVYYASNGSLILTSNGDATGTGRVDANHVHATWHVGSGGNLETWATSKGDDADTHKIFAVANTDAAVDMMIVNQSAGANAYAEFIAIHASGNTADGWVSMGVNSENYAQGAYGVTKADDAYLLYSAPVGTTESGDLVIGTSGNGTGNKIIFSADGFDDPANNTQMVITPGQNIHIEIDTESSNTTTGALTVNGGIGLVGNLNIGGNVAITGTITLGGGGNTVSTSSLQVDNPIIFVGSNNAADTFDLGFVGEYTSSGTKYTGLVRDANDSGIYKLFNGISTEPANTVDFTSASYSTLQVGGLKAVDTTASSSTTTGALIVSGGAGVAGAVNAGGAIKTTDTTASSSTTTGSLIAGGGLGVAGAVNAGGAIKTTDTTASSSTSTGSLIAGGGLGVAGNAYVGGNLVVSGEGTFTGGLRVQELIEDINDVTQSGNAMTLDYTTGTIFYRTSTNFSANFTVNITNAPTTDGRVFGVTLFQTQGATGYRPTTLNINGSAVTIKWSGASAPTPTSTNGRIDVFSFLIIRRSSAYEALVSSSLNFG